MFAEEALTQPSTRAKFCYLFLFLFSFFFLPYYTETSAATFIHL